MQQKFSLWDSPALSDINLWLFEGLFFTGACLWSQRREIMQQACMAPRRHQYQSHSLSAHPTFNWPANNFFLWEVVLQTFPPKHHNVKFNPAWFCVKKIKIKIYIYIYSQTHLFGILRFQMQIWNPLMETSTPQSRMSRLGMFWCIYAMTHICNANRKFTISNIHRTILATYSCT